MRNFCASSQMAWSVASSSFDTAPPSALRGIQGVVRPGDPSRDVILRCEHGHARGERDVEWRAVHGRLFDRAEGIGQPGDEVVYVPELRVGQEDGELLAVVARHGVAAAQVACEECGEAAQDRIAGETAEAV